MVPERTRRRWTGTVLATLLAAAPLAAADGNWLIERTELTQAVGDTPVSVVNLYGDIRCRVVDEAEMLLIANAQRHREDPRSMKVEMREDGGRWHVEVVYPKLEEAEKARLTPEMERRRVDVAILVPASAPLLVLRTADGLIEGKGVRQAVEATSEKGRIFLRTSGEVRAHTDHGELEVTLRTTEWEEAPELSTLTGDITVWLPPDPSARVEAETHGELSTDFSIEIRRRDDLKKMAVATLGDGGGRLVLRSEKGRIRLFESRW